MSFFNEIERIARAIALAMMEEDNRARIARINAEELNKAQSIHVVVSGNPGVGKSTILNSILGRYHFTAGVSGDGAGVTSQVTKVRYDGIYLVDTPGVSEVARSSDNMKTLINAISAQVNTKVMFIMTVDAGRIKPADVLLFQLILDHVGRNNIANVALIINKVTPSLLIREANLKSVICSQFGVNAESIFMIPNYGDATTLLPNLPFAITDGNQIRVLEDGDWNYLAKRALNNQREEGEYRLKQAQLEEENRQRIARIQRQNAREVERLQRQAERNRGWCSIM